MNKKVTIFLFHPRLEESRVNKKLVEAAKSIDNVEVKDMYELYPDFNIDVRKEQEDLLRAELVVMQHPFYWYSIPPLFKQWIDLVLEHGWAYGSKGDKLQNKKIFHVISSGGSFEAYCQKGKNTYTYTELLRPLELTYRLCNMHALPPFLIPGTFKIGEDDLASYFQQYRSLLQKAAETGFEGEELEQVAFFNQYKF